MNSSLRRRRGARHVYSDFACSNGYGYLGSSGTIDTRYTHWNVSAYHPPVISLR